MTYALPTWQAGLDTYTTPFPDQPERASLNDMALPRPGALNPYTHMSDDDLLRLVSAKRADLARKTNVRSRIQQEQQNIKLLQSAQPSDLVGAPGDVPAGYGLGGYGAPSGFPGDPVTAWALNGAPVNYSPFRPPATTGNQTSPELRAAGADYAAKMESDRQAAIAAQRTSRNFTSAVAAGDPGAVGDLATFTAAQQAEPAAVLAQRAAAGNATAIARRAHIQQLVQDDINARERGVVQSARWNDEAQAEADKNLKTQLALNADQRAQSLLDYQINAGQTKLGQGDRRLDQRDTQIAGAPSAVAVVQQKAYDNDAAKRAGSMIESGDIATPEDIRRLFPRISPELETQLATQFQGVRASRKKDFQIQSDNYSQAQAAADEYNTRLAEEAKKHPVAQLPNVTQWSNTPINLLNYKNYGNPLPYFFPATAGSRIASDVAGASAPDPSQPKFVSPIQQALPTIQQALTKNRNDSRIVRYDSKAGRFVPIGTPPVDGTLSNSDRSFRNSGADYVPGNNGGNMIVEGARAKLNGRIIQYRGGQWIDIGPAS